jgi:hypothetical protein
MTGNEIAIRGDVDLAVIEPLSKFAAQIAKTEFVPSNLRNRPEAVLACFMTGQELGIAPMRALRQIDIIDGRPALRSELMRSLVLNAGHSLWYGEGNEFTTTRVVAYGQRKDGGPVSRVEWTMDMAKTAKLDGKNNWRNTPRAMLTARATGELCRMIFPDVIAGMGYTREELEDSPPNDDEIVEAEVVESRPKTKKKVPAQRRNTAPATQATSPAPPLPDDDIEDAEVVELAEEPSIPTAKAEATDEEKSRSRQVVRLAKALKIDHHPVVAAITSGVTESAARLSAAEAVQVMDTLRSIDAGRVKVYTPEGSKFPRIVAMDPQESTDDSEDDIEDAEVVSDEIPLPDEDEDDDDDPENWDSDQWRAFINAQGVKVVAVLKEAARICPPGETPVGSLQSISGSGIAGQLRDYVIQYGG